MKPLQEKVQTFTTQHNLSSPIEHRMLDLVSEVGEVSKEVLKMSNYGWEPIQYREDFAEELGDVLYSLIGVANHFEVDLEEALHRALSKYERRLGQGSMGSESGK